MPVSLSRRGLFGAAAATLAAPRLARADAARILRFIPQSDLGVLDPIWTAAYVTRNHAMMLFDTLYGTDAQYRAVPQMLAGHVVDSDDRVWRLTLREGLRFHDGTPVLARDCVASIRRWGARDSFGQTLLAVTDELAAPDDRTITFRLKRPFPLLPAALGKAGSNVCAIMPERLATTDPFKQVTEMVGSGPFRFKADERIPGARVVYERFDGYVPRSDGTPSFTAGPKRVFVDRVEWTVLPDAATAAAALQAGEVDWWEAPTFDLLPVLRRSRDIAVVQPDPLGYMALLRFNHLQPPFDNPALRRAILGAVSQMDYMTAVGGDDAANWTVPAGVFPPGTPLATDAGLSVLTGPRDLAAVKRAVAESGYKGERVVVMVPSDFPTLKALGDVGADMLSRAGLNVDAQYADWGTVLQRLAKTEPVEQGGWSAFHTYWSGLDQIDPAVHVSLRGNGRSASRGWPTSPKLEALRAEWLAATDPAMQRSLAADMQRQVWVDVPYIPLGQIKPATAYRKRVTEVLGGYSLFWNLRLA
ncbi:MAG: ABC transporter substrate-binding protein [Rhodospirillales bacterium 69-11]|nr:ABC transporter substrate-binding protein [Rhodospirillales bacterium]OJW24395.1 MAG: ABC transporter substrate-binding protein [Rhodospirillales bacterium 69-11]